MVTLDGQHGLRAVKGLNDSVVSSSRCRRIRLLRSRSSSATTIVATAVTTPASRGKTLLHMDYTRWYREPVPNWPSMRGGEHERSAVSRQPSAVSRQPSAVSKECPADR